jgi:2-polyprenyl-3-methyl-5-hydroxy-6-metoxy-1,4-benzoquinol methylase
LDAIPPGCERALDVGCGTGALTRRLKLLVPHVTGIDRDERSIQLARAHPGGAGIGYHQADFLTAPLESAAGPGRPRGSP